MGDPEGIGGEIALQAWCRRGETGPRFFLVDAPERLADLAKRIGVPATVRAIETPEEASTTFEAALPVLPVRPGKNKAETVVASIEMAADFVRNGRAAALVTNPIHKESLYLSGFRHQGHTEFLADLAGAAQAPVMMLACRELRVVPVTIHLSLAEAVAALDTDAIVHCGRTTAKALAMDFAIPNPRIAVAALNPHAGEGGHLGREEIDIIRPAVAQLTADGIDATGPLPADTLFHDRARRSYDAVLCMYHDQALIPLKTIDFANGVNITLGLPFVRTSPDHGVAFDIAGTGRADPSSLIAAITMADEMARRRDAVRAAVA
jgi:4-hydroxythreonine-4-phosphate dehydrogenase